MNPARALAWLQLGGAVAVLAGVAILAFFAVRWLRDPGALGETLKKSPLGIPSRAIDAGISKATKREETLGGFLAEVFDPTTREVNRVLKTPATKPVLTPNDIDAELRAGSPAPAPAPVYYGMNPMDISP